MNKKGSVWIPRGAISMFSGKGHQDRPLIFDQRNQVGNFPTPESRSSRAHLWASGNMAIANIHDWGNVDIYETEICCLTFSDQATGILQHQFQLYKWVEYHDMIEEFITHHCMLLLQHSWWFPPRSHREVSPRIRRPYMVKPFCWPARRGLLENRA